MAVHWIHQMTRRNGTARAQGMKYPPISTKLELLLSRIYMLVCIPEIQHVALYTEIETPDEYENDYLFKAQFPESNPKGHFIPEV